MESPALDTENAPTWISEFPLDQTITMGLSEQLETYQETYGNVNCTENIIEFALDPVVGSLLCNVGECSWVNTPYGVQNGGQASWTTHTLPRLGP